MNDLLPDWLDEEKARTFPGSELVLPGLRDLAEGRVTINSYLVSVAASNLQDCGFVVSEPFDDPEDGVYHILWLEDQDSAHPRYNALIRRLISFEKTSQREARWAREGD